LAHRKIGIRKPEGDKMPEEKPHLSIVRFSRNDNYGGDMQRRMQVCINGIVGQMERSKIKSELILVDWNPPEDKPLLKDALSWPGSTNYCTIRTIVVPSAIHRRYKHHEKIPINPAVALNTGIRRSRARFILPGAIDIIHSNELIECLNRNDLDENKMYRAYRYDVKKGVLKHDDLDKQLDYCKRHTLTFYSHLHSELEIGLPDLHTNASGDFQMLAEKYWRTLRGYPETYINSPGTDGILCYMSFKAGVKEHIFDLPLCLYHIEHLNRRHMPLMFRYLENILLKTHTPERIRNRIIWYYKKIFKPMSQVEKSGLPENIDYEEYRRIIYDIVHDKRPYVFNNNDWGLGREDLEEHFITRAAWEKTIQ
jgi:hypothetical protein